MQRTTSWLLITIFTLVPMQTVQASPALWFTGEQAQASERAPALTAQTQNSPTTSTVNPASQITNTVRTPLTLTQATGSTTPTLAITTTGVITPQLPITNTAGVTFTTSLTVAPPPLTTAVTSTLSPSATTAGPLEGTIIANRTDTAIRFFVEGKTYELSGLRSQGINLPRGTAVLNLFNCDAKLPETQAGCYWDPYLLNQNGFYEIVTGADAGKAVNFTLREAGSPPVDQIWVQNRTSEEAVLFYNTEQFTVAPGAVAEFTGEEKLPLTLYLRSCLEVASRTVCEWYPNNAALGVFYALTAITTSGTVPDSRISALELQPIVAAQPPPSGPPTTNTETPQPPTAAQIVCSLQVPAINVRTGPGLEYEIIAKVRGTEEEPGTVLVVGRDNTSQWLAVTERVASGGWITSNTDFVKCTGDVSALPEATVTDGRLLATPTPASVTDAQGQDGTANPQAAAEAPAENPEATSDAPPPTIPDGQALLIVNNGFDQVMRFTVDQRFRVEQGTSEFDLLPGQSLSLFVIPGQIAFTASTPWRGLADNADFFIDNRQTRTLYLTFVPDPDDSGQWLLQF